MPRGVCRRNGDATARIRVVDAAPAWNGLATWEARLPRPFPGKWHVEAGRLHVETPAPVDWFPSPALEAVWQPTFREEGGTAILDAALPTVPPDVYLVMTRGTDAWQLTLPSESP